MAFGVEAVSNNTTGKAAGVGTTYTVSFTVTNANLLLVGVAIGFGNTDPLTGVTGVTYNGVAMTAVSGSDSDDNNFEGVRWYKLANPDPGTHDIVATFNINAQGGVGAVSFIDADTTLRTPSVATNTTANPSLTVVDSASGNIVVSGLATDGAGFATAAAGTSIADIENIDGDSDFNFQYQTASGANTVASWTNASTTDPWAASGVAVKPAPTGQTVAIGQPSEADSALTGTRVKTKAMGQPSESDAVTAMAVNGSSVFLDVAHARELRNQSNVAWSNVNGWTYAWYDSFDNLFSSGGTPTGTGTFNTNASGEARIEIPGTALAAGQSGALMIRHPNYPTTAAFALLTVPLGP